MDAPLFVLGSGGHAKVVLSILSESGQRVKALLDDDSKKWGSELMEVPIVGAISEIGKYAKVRGIIAVGNNYERKKIAETYPHVEWVSAIHKTAYLHSSARKNLGKGSVICAGSVVQPDATVGHHSIINTGTTVDHDCSIGSYAHLAPGVHLAGEVTVGDGVLMGVGSSAVPLASIGSWSVIGAGAGVIQSIPENVTAVGFPAKETMKVKTRKVQVAKETIQISAS